MWKWRHQVAAMRSGLVRSDAYKYTENGIEFQILNSNCAVVINIYIYS